MNMKTTLRILHLIAFAGICAALLPAQSNCRMKRSQIVPIIDRYNPFFTDHTWEDETKTEVGRMDSYRLVVIKQKACMRHHVMFSMLVDKAAIEKNYRFWVKEVLVMLKRVYFHNTGFLTYKAQFEKEFVRHFMANGVNKTFTFPIDDRTFICKIENGSWGGKVQLEIVKLIMRARVKQPGISREKDDAWFNKAKEESEDDDWP